MGIGVGGVDALIPIYSSELSNDGQRGKALAQEFQMNILGLNMAFGINLAATRALGKGRGEAETATLDIHGQEEGPKKFKALKQSARAEESHNVSYLDMLTPEHPQFHPTFISIMGQVNQAFTGYDAVSVYGPQIFELPVFKVRRPEELTQANYISYLIFITLSWLLIDAVGRRSLMVLGSAVLTTSFLLLALFGGLAMNNDSLNILTLAAAIPGIFTLFVATWAFGVCWLATVWLIPTELFPAAVRGKAAAVSVVVWGLANFVITFLTPVMFNNLSFYIFLVFAARSAFAGLWTWIYLPESGNRSSDKNIQFFEDAARAGYWRVSQVDGGRYLKMPYSGEEDAARTPLLRRVEDQLRTP
ncbi:uncharacterized protein PV09_00469 [Verruconis gallopava]|uniref:Major facilitator superfamily (MFS) profile domain-containing protein n=1 Tax=Verruconis gallopava TaxID=253628 RepID=A0A0D2ASY9_9PEZI|nr:uncharacterized protein PV09_00469 [Verruconis gallopava]KIW09600.1 hypothetical protein PV09_00469 [Verruconis gallopava]